MIPTSITLRLSKSKQLMCNSKALTLKRLRCKSKTRFVLILLTTNLTLRRVILLALRKSSLKRT